jgi:hypothetical protein
MKALVLVILIIAIVSVMAWRMRQSRAAAALARRKDLDRRKRQEKEALTPEIDMLWPVIIRPVKGDQGSSADARVAEPSMTTIEYTPPEKAAS